MRWAVKAIATVGFVGYVPRAPGTAGSLAGLLVGLLTAPAVKDPHPYPLRLLIGVVACFFLGVVVSTRAEREFGVHDPRPVVIDECWAMWAILVAAPLLCHAWPLTVVAFGLFRAFDIAKPFPLKDLGRLPGGWGIMLDDLGAAGYTVLVLWVVLALLRAPL